MTLIKTGLPMFRNLPSFFDDDWLKTRFINDEWFPAVNIVDNDKNYEIEMAVPGFKKDDFNVLIENDMLTIEGKTEHEKEEKDKTYTRKEFSSKSFKRSFTLPENVETEKIEAKYTDGVLRLELLKNKKVTKPVKKIMIG